MNILYIEDNPNDAKLVQRYVESMRHTLVIAPTLERAYATLANPDAFDLILVDILIDNKRSGYELAQALSDRGYTRPVIAVTALISLQDQQACVEAGFAAVISKPFVITTLADTLAQFS